MAAVSEIWSSGASIKNACDIVNQNLDMMKNWCDKWNMSIAADKTEVLVFPYDGKQPEETVSVKYGEELLKVTNSKKVLGIVLDSCLNFKEHIQEKTKAGFAALRSIDSFIVSQRGCSQSVYMRLYKALILPVLEYGDPVYVPAMEECSKEFGKVQRCAMLKASGCLSSSSTEALAILTNTPPIDLQLKLRQAQEVVRISAKHDDDPLRAEFDAWISGDSPVGRKPTIFHLLMTRFREMSGRLEFDSIEKEFKYSMDIMGLMKVKGKVDTDDFVNSKNVHVENIRDKLNQIKEDEIVIFTDGSALGNPGPTGAGAVIYMNGYHTSPILLKRGVGPMNNNYTGELVGIQIALKFMVDLEGSAQLSHKNIHFFTDCQAAIIAAFNNTIPNGKVDIILKIKESINYLSVRGNSIHVHLVPGHKDILGNELADKQAKEAATEMIKVDNKDFPIFLDKKEAVSEIKKNLKAKWKRKYELSEKVDQIQDVFTEVGCRNCFGEKDRHTFSILNQLLTCHTLLNQHRAKVNKNVKIYVITAKFQKIPATFYLLVRLMWTRETVWEPQ